MNKALISLFDHSGNQSRPYREAGYIVEQIDIKHGKDVMDFDPVRWLNNNSDYSMPQIGIIAPIPCTCYALCGNRHKAKRLLSGEFAASQLLVQKTRDIIDWFDKIGILQFWQVENPKTDIHTHNPWLKPRIHKFNPCDYAGYDPIPDNSRYNKETWLFGRFNHLTPKRIEPFIKENPGWRDLGGKSERTKELRSITPLGFAYAFFEANN
jgi:hypothetical protein